ncbi:MAG: 30S ribosomal protein S9 [Candidatus Levybacteria bacterium]|nr:30S ribosomal protein S9 [Candidatus Levybacteria bacterium]
MSEEIKIQDSDRKTKHNIKRDYIFAVGRRREAVARVRLYEHLKDQFAWDGSALAKGELYVNKKPIAEYFSGNVMRYMYSEPLRVTNTQNKFTWTIQVTGGGLSGQLDAVITGIAHALNKLDREKYRPNLKKNGFLTRDSRIRERRKVGMGGKARRKRQSPKR